MSRALFTLKNEIKCTRMGRSFRVGSSAYSDIHWGISIGQENNNPERRQNSVVATKPIGSGTGESDDECASVVGMVRKRLEPFLDEAMSKRQNSSNAHQQSVMLFSKFQA